MTSRRRLRSSASHRQEVPPVRLSTVGKQAFQVAGANMWNDLLLHVTSAQSLAVFKQSLKTFLFFSLLPGHSYYMTYYFPFLGIPCEPCNLGHVKHVDDDDDDADDDDDNDDDDDDENLRFFAISLIPISLEAPRKEGFLGLMV